MEAAGLPRTLEDREEWGDPVKDPRHRRAIASYCPVHNVTPQVSTRTPERLKTAASVQVQRCHLGFFWRGFHQQQYPSILLTAYREDARIPLEGVLRYARRLRSAVEASGKRSFEVTGADPRTQARFAVEASCRRRTHSGAGRGASVGVSGAVAGGGSVNSG